MEEFTLYQKSRKYKNEYMADPVKVIHGEVSEKIRNTVVDWLFDVCNKFDLQLQTYFLAINYFDRFLSRNETKISNIQKVGSACLFIAAKYEEMYIPEANDFVWISANTFTRKQLIQQEKEILESLKYHLNYITPLSYVQELTYEMNEQLRLNSEYICFLTTMLIYFSNFDAIDIAAICVYIASKITNDLEVADDKITRDLKNLYDSGIKLKSLYFKKMEQFNFKISPSEKFEFKKEGKSPSKRKDLPRPKLPLPFE